jgi:hypothetical protein
MSLAYPEFNQKYKFTLSGNTFTISSITHQGITLQYLNGIVKRCRLNDWVRWARIGTIEEVKYVKKENMGHPLTKIFK